MSYNRQNVLNKIRAMGYYIYAVYHDAWDTRWGFDAGGRTALTWTDFPPGQHNVQGLSVNYGNRSEDAAVEDLVRQYACGSPKMNPYLWIEQNYVLQAAFIKLMPETYPVTVPTIVEMQAILAADPTNNHAYDPLTYNCGDFCLALHNSLLANYGITSHYALLYHKNPSQSHVVLCVPVSIYGKVALAFVEAQNDYLYYGNAIGIIDNEYRLLEIGRTINKNGYWWYLVGKYHTEGLKGI